MFSFNKPQRKYTHAWREIKKYTDFDTNMDRLGMVAGVLALTAIIIEVSGLADAIIRWFEMI